MPNPKITKRKTKNNHYVTFFFEGEGKRHMNFHIWSNNGVVTSAMRWVVGFSEDSTNVRIRFEDVPTNIKSFVTDWLKENVFNPTTIGK